MGGSGRLVASPTAIELTWLASERQHDLKRHGTLRRLQALEVRQASATSWGSSILQLRKHRSVLPLLLLYELVVDAGVGGATSG